jgi:hypothetical protein
MTKNEVPGKRDALSRGKALCDISDDSSSASVFEREVHVGGSARQNSRER